ncbi:MAG: MSMEG_4193 family putative phosphomutase [Anaerolineae bacterium]|nr:MSMEG_4193 family putative phosphomutase [Anaerolineae bacterium]
MTTVLLIRHAVNDWVKTGKLAGWEPGVHLNAEGRAQAAALGQRLADRPLRAIYASPLERTLETAQAVAEHHPALKVAIAEGVGEVDFGEWQGRRIKDLARRKMWHVIQYTPTRAYFPGGESMRAAQVRAVDTVEELAGRHRGQVIAVVSHSDIIKMVLAHYLGMPLDLFQRIVVSPASISVVQLGYGRPYVALVNDTSHCPVPAQDANQTV